MNTRVLGIALATALAPSAMPAQMPVHDTATVSAAPALSQAARTMMRLTSGASVLSLGLPDARLALPDSAAVPDLMPALSVPHRWVRTGKWSLLAAAAGLSAYAMLHSRGEGPDRRAQIGIAGAHLALVGSAGLFIYDLRHSRRERENIPFEASASSGSRSAGAGVTAVR